jgi:RimJ/RimL family protein N-acetyltransferase
MAHPYWPLFDLRVRTPRLELRLPTEDELVGLADLAARGVHDPATMPFDIPWTDTPQPDLQRRALQWWWRARAEWQPEQWTLTLMVSEVGAGGRGTPVGVQDLVGERFAVRRTVHTGSWLGLDHQGRGLGKEMRAAVLHLAFAGLGAERAETAAWHDNVASLGVTRSLGYRPNGDRVGVRRGQAEHQLDFVLTRADWRARDDIQIEGLDPCLPLFGVESDS